MKKETKEILLKGIEKVQEKTKNNSEIIIEMFGEDFVIIAPLSIHKEIRFIYENKKSKLVIVERKYKII